MAQSHYLKHFSVALSSKQIKHAREISYFLLAQLSKQKYFCKAGQARGKYLINNYEC